MGRIRPCDCRRSEIEMVAVLRLDSLQGGDSPLEAGILFGELSNLLGVVHVSAPCGVKMSVVGENLCQCSTFLRQFEPAIGMLVNVSPDEKPLRRGNRPLRPQSLEQFGESNRATPAARCE